MIEKVHKLIRFIQVALIVEYGIIAIAVLLIK